MSASTSSFAWPASTPRPTFRLGRESKSESEWTVGWVWRRNGAGASRQVLAWYAALCALSLAVSSAFWSHGAEVVLPFVWVQLMLVGGVSWGMLRHASDRECIELRGDLLTVEHANGSHVERVEFKPAWVRVEPEHGDRSLIELSGQGQRIAVGRFIHPEQRRQLAEELRFALRRWHQGGTKPASM